MNILGSALVYAGLIVGLAGFASVVKPWRRVGSRKRGLGLLGIGVLAVLAGCLLPADEMRSGGSGTRLDEFLPAYQFQEVDRMEVNAGADKVHAAIQAVAPDEILFFRTLTWLRRFGKRGPESILNASGRKPILETATARWFVRLVEDPGREVVIGVAAGGRGIRKLSPEEFKEFRKAPLAKIAMNFRVVEEDAGRCMVITETRVYAAGPPVVRRFAAYWRVIYPGSALMRHTWLRAIKLRAEGAR
jgi:hypothetical protein